MKIPNISGTKCPKCNKVGFELAEDFPSGSAWIFQYIRCSHCKTFLQALPHNNTNIMVENLHEDVKKIKSKLGILDL